MCSVLASYSSTSIPTARAIRTIVITGTLVTGAVGPPRAVPAGAVIAGGFSGNVRLGTARNGSSVPVGGQDFPGLGYLRLGSLAAYFNDFNGNLDFYDRSNLADS